MNNYQNQKQSQQQKHGYYMSQQHLKLMHLMHLSGYALREYIANEVELNPVLEIESEPEDANVEEEPAEDEFDNELLWQDNDDLFEKTSKQQQSSKEYYEAPVVQYNTLQETLKEQIQMMKLIPEIAELAYYLIDELDDDGYLRRNVGEVADDFGFLNGKVIAEEKIEKALSALQQCEPAGIGARNLRECLLLQLNRIKLKGCFSHSMSIKLLEEKYTELTQHQFEKIKTDLDITGEDLEKCITLISKLTPKPVFETNKYELLKEQIVPDFEVGIEDNELFVSLTSSEFMKLKVNEEYINLNKDVSGKKGKKQAENYFQNLVSDALMLVNALKDREVTMINVMRVIVQMQPAFFKSGDMKELKPMILQDIADKTGFDISAISRITSNKHVQTPFGIFPLKNLFMRAVSTEEAGSAGATSLQVQELIQKIVKDEDKTKPLSDTEIMNLLKKQDINVARRTIVKYRELSGIPNSTIRKKQLILN